MSRAADPLSNNAAAASSEDSFRNLSEVQGPILLRYLTRLTGGDRHHAEDLLQETILRAWNNPSSRRPDGRWSRAWLFTVAQRIAIDRFRAVRARAPELLDDRIEDHAGADDINSLVDSHEVQAALVGLPEHLRVTLVEIFFHERSIAETAEILQVPAGTVKSRTFCALRAMQAALIQRGFIA